MSVYVAVAIPIHHGMHPCSGLQNPESVRCQSAWQSAGCQTQRTSRSSSGPVFSECLFRLYISVFHGRVANWLLVLLPVCLRPTKRRDVFGGSLPQGPLKLSEYLQSLLGMLLLNLSFHHCFILFALSLRPYLYAPALASAFYCTVRAAPRLRCSSSTENPCRIEAQDEISCPKPFKEDVFLFAVLHRCHGDLCRGGWTIQQSSGALQSLQQLLISHDRLGRRTTC